MRLTYEAMLNDPNLIDIAHANARRERAKAVHDLIVLPIKRFFTEPAARPQLARQG